MCGEALFRRRGGLAAIAIALAIFSLRGTAHAEEVAASQAFEGATEEAADVVEVERALRIVTQRLESGEPGFTIELGDDSDWLLTTSGEWVRGSVDFMRDDIVSFDSDEFGGLDINMREVAGIHAARSHTYLLYDNTLLVGPAMVTPDALAVETPSGVVVRPREDLRSVVEGGGREIDYWALALDVGLGLNRGNSNQADVNMRLYISREDKRTLTEVAYLMNLGYADREVNVSRHVVAFANRFWITRRWFVEPIVGQLLSDRFQDIRFRAQPAATAGIRFLDVPTKARWDLMVGFGYQYLRLFEPFVDVKNPQHDGLSRFATRARFDFTPDIYLTLDWVTNLTFTTVGNTNHTGFAELFFEVTNILNLQATFLYLRTEKPPARADGTLPARNDYFLTFGVSLQLG